MIGRRHDSQNRRSIFAIVVLASALLAWPCGELLGNEAQGRICNAGLGFGQAEARTYLFGRAMQGRIPADQLTAISTNLSNAAAEIAAAEALFGRPYSTEPSRLEAVARLIADIGRFPASTARDSYSHRAAKIQNLAGRYLSTLQSTFVSSRGDAFQYNSTCDSLIFNACYFYGKATIASLFEDDRSGSFEAGAIGTYRTSVREGLAIAMDAAGHTPPDGHARKICCTFGTPAAWEAMRPLQLRNSLATYAGLEVVLRGIIANAAGLDPACASGDSVRCASSSVHPTPPGPDPPEPVVPPEPAEFRWVLTQTLVNPKNAPMEFVVGVTPNYHSPRFAGSYERYSVSENNIHYSTREQDHGNLWYDVNLSVALSALPAELNPGETVNLTASFSHTGTLNQGNPGIRFEYRGEGINLAGDRMKSYFPWASGAGGPTSIHSNFVVPKARSGGKIKLHAFLWHCEACSVTWIYEAQ